VNAEYRAITGRRYEVSGLSADERKFLENVFALFASKPAWADFTRTWSRLARETIWKGQRVPVGNPVQRICQDLAARLGIAEGRISRPDYRERIADLIEERFKSRYEFCKSVGIDEGQLSRVLNRNANFSAENLFKVLDALGVEMDLVNRDEALEEPRSPFAPDPVQQLAKLQRDLDRLASLKARAGHVPVEQRLSLLESPDSFRDPFHDEIRKRVGSGEAFDSVVAEAYLRALTERTKLLNVFAAQSAEAESSARKAAS
jgi:transcriptional regulator with XRE-family HTH domain